MNRKDNIFHKKQSHYDKMISINSCIFFVFYKSVLLLFRMGIFWCFAPGLPDLFFTCYKTCFYLHPAKSCFQRRITLELLTLAGQQIIVHDVGHQDGNTYTLNVSALPEGAYVLRVTNGRQSVSKNGLRKQEAGFMTRSQQVL